MANSSTEREARQFYAMIAMLKCAETIGNYLVNAPEPVIHGERKAEMNRMFKGINLFQRQFLRGAPPEMVKKWEADWQRDYGGFAIVLEAMSKFDDEKRARLEEFTMELDKEQIKNEAA